MLAYRLGIFGSKYEAYSRIISAVTVSIHVIKRENRSRLPFTVVVGTSFTRMFAWWNMYLVHKLAWLWHQLAASLTHPSANPSGYELRCLSHCSANR
jgi:hypothetical protein